MGRGFDGGKRNGENNINGCLETKIEKAQEQVSKAKKQYDTVLAKLSNLLDKRDALRRDELVKAILKSDKTYEEVLEFLGTNTDEKDE